MRIAPTYMAEEDRNHLALSACAQAHRFALMQDQGHMVFILKDARSESVTNEGLSALRRQTFKPMLAHELELVRVGLSESEKCMAKLGVFWAQIQSSVIGNLEIFEPGEQEDVRLAALETVLSLFRVNLVVEDNPLFRTLFGTIKYESEGGNSDGGVLGLLGRRGLQR